MVDLRTVTKFQLDFKNSLETSQLKEVTSSTCSLENKETCSYDLTSLISCSQNYYEDLIKIYTYAQKVSRVLEDKKISLEGSGIVYLLVEKDSNIHLDFQSQEISHIYLKVLIKKGVSCKILSSQSSATTYVFTQIYQEEDSLCKFGEIISQGLSNQTHSFVKKNASFELLVSAQITSQNFLEHNITHQGENSLSNLKVNSIVSCKGAISDGCVKMLQNAKGSQGYLTLKNILLSTDAQILSEPKLEIYQNQVSCSHGASIAQIDPEELFYLQSRGLNKEQALALVIEALFLEVSLFLDSSFEEEIKYFISDKINF